VDQRSLRLLILIGDQTFELFDLCIEVAEFVFDLLEVRYAYGLAIRHPLGWKSWHGFTYGLGFGKAILGDSGGC
jgi:hypothetical protein